MLDRELAGQVPKRWLSNLASWMQTGGDRSFLRFLENHLSLLFY